jgi:AmmeMemoRadiSam system protein A
MHTVIETVPALADEEKEYLLKLARRTLEEHLSSGSIPSPQVDSPTLLEKRAVFVTLRRKDTGELRGCRGESIARRPLVEAVIHSAIAAAVDDPRFPPVTLGELPHLHIEISALTPLKPIRPEEVEVGRHGLMIILNGYAGLLLPQVPTEYGWSAREFLDALCQKAGLPPGAWRDPRAQLYGFESEVWEE